MVMTDQVLERYRSFRELVAAQFSEKTQRMVDEALLLAEKQLQGVVRYDNSPMLDHAVAVARIIVEEVGLGRNSTIAAILHDVVRIALQEQRDDREELTESIRQRFGDEVLGITVALCKISDIKLPLLIKMSVASSDIASISYCLTR